MVYTAARRKKGKKSKKVKCKRGYQATPTGCVMTEAKKKKLARVLRRAAKYRKEGKMNPLKLAWQVEKKEIAADVAVLSL